ncbi:MAG: glycoside hydrolase family 43 protein [Eubacteriales bacterium]|nr:glycoside hydrolase family 43 protein [Eubacteriales bacterium]
MKTNEVNIRDPYVLLHEDKYYLYGTRSATCWGEADGFDCYVSENLEDWEGPTEIFHRPEGFFADREYWAPECIFYAGAFYLITTFGGENRKKGIYVLRSECPTGPFELYSERLTPEDWVCIDGTVYLEGDTPILFFSHSFEDTPDGDMCMIPLSKDLKRANGEAVVLFSAGEAEWAKPVPFAKAEFGMDGDVYFTDGPCVNKLEDGRLYMTWSSWGDCGYAVGVAVSESGLAKGPWKQMNPPIFPVNGGHGMVFRDKGGTLRFTLHFPNDKYMERPMFARLVLESGGLRLEK